MNTRLYKIVITVSVLVSYSVCHSQTSDTDSLNILLIYGSENYKYAKAQEFVANKWDVKVYRIAGITVDQKIVDSAATVNSSLWTKLDKTLNQDSKKLFKADVISEMKNITIAQTIYDKNRKLRRVINKIENKRTGTYSILKSKENELTYIYIINSYSKSDIDVQSKVLKVTVNIDSKTLHIEN